MKKLALFVEGLTEQLFALRLLQELAGQHALAFSILKGASSRPGCPRWLNPRGDCWNAEAQLDVEAVLKEYVRLEREITEKAKDHMEKRRLPYEQFRVGGRRMFFVIMSGFMVAPS